MRDTSDKEEPDRAALQTECWNKSQDNPQINTSVRGTAGRLAGLGFEATSEVPEIQEAIEEIEEDPRNRLYNFWPKYVARAKMEGELYLTLTCHEDSFIEVDFTDPAALTGGSEGDGIIFHPTKTTMPLAYIVKRNDDTAEEIIPSIFMARYPELKQVAIDTDPSFKLSKAATSRKRAFASVGGFKRFMVSWDQGFITRRNVSHLRTVLQWINQYELLKKYEIDHKRSAGAYLWVATIADTNAFRLWLSLSDEEKRKTGIGAPKTPGGTLILPPGMDFKPVNPNLPNISDSDTDILHMVTAGLNEPEDVTTGQSKGTFASVKASRGPMSDRISDEVAYFGRFLRYDFWGSIFFLKSRIGGFPEKFKMNRVVGFKNQKPIKKDVQIKPEKLIDLSFPKTEVVDVETRARAYLGVKHGSTNQVLGVSNKRIASEMGFGNYHQLRVESANEDEQYPDLVVAADAEALQEKVLEPGKPGPVPAKKTGTPKPGIPSPKKTVPKKPS